MSRRDAQQSRLEGLDGRGHNDSNRQLVPNPNGSREETIVEVEVEVLRDYSVCWSFRTVISLHASRHSVPGHFTTVTIAHAGSYTAHQTVATLSAVKRADTIADDR